MKTLLTMSLLCAVPLAGCAVEGKVSEGSLNKMMTCTDTRDGETFAFSSNDVTNVQVTLDGGVSFDAVLVGGEKATFTSGMEAYVKCDEQPL